jgi:hypothetical protein
LKVLLVVFAVVQMHVLHRQSVKPPDCVSE